MTSASWRPTWGSALRVLSSFTTRTWPSLTPTRPENNDPVVPGGVGFAEAEAGAEEPGTELVAATADSDGDAVRVGEGEREPPPPVHAASRAPAATAEMTRAGVRDTRKRVRTFWTDSDQGSRRRVVHLEGTGPRRPASQAQPPHQCPAAQPQRRPRRLVVEPSGE